MDQRHTGLLYKKFVDEYEKHVKNKRNIDMTRGKPSVEQLNLSNDLSKDLDENDYLVGFNDYRNYGIVDGIIEAKQLFAPLLGASINEIMISGNSSLNQMFDMLTLFFLKGVPSVYVPWSQNASIKFLCPSPGYDRHFSICEYFDIKMIPVEMTETGPNMDEIEKLVESDDMIKGIFCVPKYSNPEGITYSDETVHRLASMKTKAADFTIFWDNAYALHHIYDDHDQLENILQVCKDHGNPDRAYIFSSTSKITFAGAGIAMFASSEKNIAEIKKHHSIKTIGPDKINQMRHVKFFKTYDNILKHMEKHSNILRPKFDLVLKMLNEKIDIKVKETVSWRKPNGGYFVSLDVMDGCAAEVIEKALNAGLVLNKAGSTFPYNNDPRDRNIRLAPSFLSLEDLAEAMDILCSCINMVCLGKISK